MSWVSPTSDSGDYDRWIDRTKAYDDDTAWASNAYTNPPIAELTWSRDLILNHASLSCSKVRFMGDYRDKEIETVDIDVYYSGAWHDVFEGEFSDWAQWNEYDIPAGTQDVTAMRIKFYNRESGAENIARVFEADFWEVVPPQSKQVIVVSE